MAVFLSLFGDWLYGASFWGILFSSLIGAMVGAVVSAAVFSFLAGKFGGQRNFSKAFAAVSLAWVPAFEITSKSTTRGSGMIGASLSGAISTQNAEMELVVTGDGNWAEHGAQHLLVARRFSPS